MLDPSRLSRISLIESIQGDSFKLETMLKKITDHVFNFKSIDSYKAQISTSIKNEFVDLVLGRIDFVNKQPVVITPKNLNLDNLRVLIND